MIRKTIFGLGISVIALIAFAFFVPSVAASSQGSGQFAAYSITATNSTTTFSAVVNETVSPSSTAGHSDLTLQLASSTTNFTISRLVNSSLAMLPYLPNLGNQTFDYQGHNYSISLSLIKTGTSTATVSGSPYTITSYTFQVSASRQGTNSISASGQLSVLPSGLVYSAAINSRGYSVQVQLVGTNTPLGASTSASSSAPVVIGAGVGSLAAGAGAFVLYKRRSNSNNRESKDEKPLYHVD